MSVALQEMLARCTENNLKYKVMNIGSGADILVLERGGRIFGPFFGEKPSVIWASNAWRDQNLFRNLLTMKEWNVGGDRVWIGPEIQFHIQDRTEPENTMKIPAAVDPGSYRLKALPSVCTLTQHMKLYAYNLASGIVRLQLQKCVSPATNPLRTVSSFTELMEGVDYGGYSQELTLRRTTDSAISAEAWNITQITPSGEILIPTTQQAEYADYYEPIDALNMGQNNHITYLKATGKRRYKVGLKAVHLKGDIAYFGELESVAYLYVKRFFNNPSAGYAEEPAHLPGKSGFSVHVYNDDGRIGGFSELECNMQPVGASGARESSTDIVCNWFFMGKLERLKRIFMILTGVDRESSCFAFRM